MNRKVSWQKESKRLRQNRCDRTFWVVFFIFLSVLVFTSTPPQKCDSPIQTVGAGTR